MFSSVVGTRRQQSSSELLQSSRRQQSSESLQSSNIASSQIIGDERLVILVTIKSFFSKRFCVGDVKVVEVVEDSSMTGHAGSVDTVDTSARDETTEDLVEHVK